MSNQLWQKVSARTVTTGILLDALVHSLKELRGRLIVTCTAFLLLRATLWAASLTEVQLELDGSAEPPGDILELNVAMGPAEPPLKAIINAFLIDIETGRVIGRIRSLEERYSDAEGMFLLTHDIEPETAASVSVRITVPFAALGLPVGEHCVGYIVSLSQSSGIVSERATRSTVIQVTEDPAIRRVERTIAVQKMVSLQAEVEVLIPEGDGLAERQVVVERLAPVMETRTQELTYEVPRGFLRRELRRTTFVHFTWHEDVDYAAREADYLASRPWVPLQNRRIHFATNRNVEAPQDRTFTRFGSAVANQMSYGTALVNIPVEEHRRGELETPSWWERRNAREHFFVETVLALARDDFHNVICNPLRDTSDDVLLFIHGYNTSMEFACLRMAQLTHDIRFAGAPVVFSWPSQGKASGYRDDESAAAGSGRQLGQLLNDLNARLTQQGGTSRIHILAHSMGNRVLLAGMSVLNQQTARQNSRIGHVILAAPDVDVRTFVANFPALQNLAESASLYFCENDLALRGSHVIHIDSRLGQKPVFTPGLLNIDATRADTSILGHGYFASRSELLIDIEEALDGLVPDNRKTLRRVTFVSDAVPVGNIYWMFP